MDVKRAFELAQQLVKAKDDILTGENHYAAKLALAMADNIELWREQYESAPIAESDSRSPGSAVAEVAGSAA